MPPPAARSSLLIGRLSLLAIGLIVLLPTVAATNEASYTPGPVTVLHQWLEGQCTFAPDLSVGDCCAAHDLAYQIGGNRLDRLNADLAFRRCIIQREGFLVAQIYYLGVRLFGWAFFNWHA